MCRQTFRIKAKEYKSPAPAGKDGKRRCIQCGKRKSPGAFPGERNSACSMCVRGLTKSAK